MARITLDRSWFSKLLKDYSNWKFSWCREAGQNSLDAGATEITVSISYDKETNLTTISWHDNGKGMDRDTLIARFMAVGGSQKDGENAAGGFGVAKLILAFAHHSYSIQSRDYLCFGQNDEYEIVSSHTTDGLTLTTRIEGNVEYDLCQQTKHWVKYTSAPHCNVLLNSSRLEFLPTMDTPAAVQDWCKIYLPKGDNLSSGIKVRINGQYMFNTWSSVDACVLVDITGASLDYLTSNRDSLQCPYGSQLSKLIEQMFKDPKKLFDIDEDIIEVYEGELGPVIREKDEGEVEYQQRRMRRTANVVAFIPPGQKRDFISNPYSDEELASQKKEDKTLSKRINMQGRHDMVVLNKTSQPIPSNWQPANMKANEWALFNRWTRIVGAVATILDVEVTLRTGWYFSTSGAAAHKNNSTYGHLILLNPCVLIHDSKWQNTFKADKDSFNTLVAYALHEITHVKEDYHDEGFAREMTLNAAKVFGRISEVNKAK